MPPLPPRLLARARRAAKGVEVGAGSDFATSLALLAANPGASWWVTDVDARVLDAPAPLVARVMDVRRPDAEVVRGADLVVAVRVPEELQAACATLARSLGADLALRALKDEWADLAPWPHETWEGGWRFWRDRGAGENALASEGDRRSP